MSFPKKKSRSIEVNGIAYRYCVTNSGKSSESYFELQVIVQVANGEGTLLRVTGLLSRDYWLDFPDISTNSADYPVILPMHIANFIKQALQMGWNPDSREAAFVLKIDNLLTF